MSLTALIPLLGTVIDKILPDKDQAEKAKVKLAELHQSGELSAIESQVRVIVAEASSQHKLAAIWRPLIMLMFGVIVANNYIVYPYLSLFFDAAPKLDLPPDLWALMKLGLGGYVVGRSAEKVIASWRQGA